MQPIRIKTLTESLTLLIPIRQEDGEGGWTENWRRGPPYGLLCGHLLRPKIKHTIALLCARGSLSLTNSGFYGLCDMQPNVLLS